MKVMINEYRSWIFGTRQAEQAAPGLKHKGTLSS
jgi:hypothetical protein